MDAEFFRRHLERDLIPFWNGLCDAQCGGFYGRVLGDGAVDKKSEKGAILNSRILWFYSSAYLSLKKKPLLKMAEHAYQFLVGRLYDARYGGIFWSADFAGNPLDQTKHVYNMAFAIYALSAYYRASKKREALCLAYALYDTLEGKCRDKSGYGEAFSRDFFPIKNDKLSENGVTAERTMNTLLHVMEAYTELYAADHFEKVAASLKEILFIFKEKIFDARRGICNAFFDKNYSPLIDLESYGHDIEASWLIDRTLDLLGDKKIAKEMQGVVAALAESAKENGVDKRLFALNAECENGVVNQQKIWWVQAEAVTGFYNMYQKNSGQKEYLSLSEKILAFIQSFVIDKKTGEWFELAAPGSEKQSAPLVHPWKCPYHNGRMCLEMMRRLS